MIELNSENPCRRKLTLAQRLWVWLSADPGQWAIGVYRLGGEELFHPSAANPK